MHWIVGMHVRKSIRAGLQNGQHHRLATVTPTRRSLASFRRCRAAPAGQMRRSPSSCGYRERASPTKCARSISGECLASRSGPAAASPSIDQGGGALLDNARNCYLRTKGALTPAGQTKPLALQQYGTPCCNRKPKSRSWSLGQGNATA
jgi:hypothetical protein